MKKNLVIMREKYDQTCLQVHSKINAFILNQRGGADGGTPGWVFGLCIAVLLLIGVYVIFKEKLPGFIDSIFNKFTNLD
ncbi:hypothetical protein [Paenibacillus solani]|uniref:hypothetical protein n=1 Tax=Paenibacillus solani TaxID=1705565 RepID=UPI003D2C7893